MRKNKMLVSRLRVGDRFRAHGATWTLIKKPTNFVPHYPKTDLCAQRARDGHIATWYPSDQVEKINMSLLPVRIDSLEIGDQFFTHENIGIWQVIGEPEKCNICIEEDRGSHAQFEGCKGYAHFRIERMVIPYKGNKMATKKVPAAKKKILDDVIVETRKLVKVPSADGHWEIEIEQDSRFLKVNAPCGEEVTYTINELRKVAQAILDHFPEK